ncbi:MAG TPA: transcription elongation factor GreA [Planctomycetota bacterium]|nr:transcription elongation factor GreA [Planctomycetota bacterium]
MSTVPMTQEGLDKLKADLLVHEERRPKVLLQIKEAREKGDLSENAEYHAAREDLSMLENQIRILKDKIGRAAIVDKSKIGGDAIVFGATVKLKCFTDGEIEEFTLVGEGENDPFSNRILTTSPMGQALLTRKVGDTIEVPTPKGAVKFEILKVEYK